MKLIKSVALVFIIIFSSCQPKVENLNSEDQINTEKNTIWRGVISLNDSTELPFNFGWKSTAEKFEMTIMNGEERIVSNSVLEIDDSLKIEFPVFTNYLKVKLTEDKMLGSYVNPDFANYILPFKAFSNDTDRFVNSESIDPCCSLHKKWAVKFSPETEDEYPAIAYFEQNGKKVTGTFNTETGDYRFLEGNLNGNTLQLSTFDGAHLFMFKGNIIESDSIDGVFYSGRTWSEPWLAYRDDAFELSDPDSLTYLKEGFKTIAFSFLNEKGDMISLSDPKFENKPVILQIMGTWCPNCMDESRYLKKVYDQYNSKGLEIISLGFERPKNAKAVFKRINKLRSDLELEYPILWAGSSNKKEAARVLPMLNHVMSFPTAIYLNRKHEIVKIHTGFSGPGTPLYEKYVAQNKILLDLLVEGKDK